MRYLQLLPALKVEKRPTYKENGNIDTETPIPPAAQCGKMDQKHERLKKLGCQIEIKTKASIISLEKSDNQTQLPAQIYKS